MSGAPAPHPRPDDPPQGQDIRQIADLGHDKPTLLLRMDAGPARLIDRYAPVIENTIADAIDFMDALSAIVPMKIDLDLQITLMASALILRIGKGLEGAHPRARHRRQRQHHRPDRTPRSSSRRLHAEPIPWLDDRTLRIELV